MSRPHPSIAVFAFIFFVSAASINGQVKTRNVVTANRGAVATDVRVCSKIGMDVIREGGHAVDAAVAAAFCLEVTSPASSGIGGGAFMLLRLANGEAKAFDMRETAPLRSSKDMYGGNATLKSTGGLAIAVPGELKGLHMAWRQHGKLPWARLVKPAEAIARNGFRVSNFLRDQLEKSEAAIMNDEGLRSVFAPHGKLLKIGELFFNKKLAQTFRIIAKYGPKAFYRGPIGLNIVKDVQKAKGILTMEDLKRYTVKQRKPISIDFLGLKLIGMPPPSGGAATMLLLNILSSYNLPSDLSGPLGVHRQIEAMKHVFAVRMNLGDPDFLNITELVSDMLSPKFGRALRRDINDNKTLSTDQYGGKWNQINDHGTTHISIIDFEKNAISMTCTINAFFGSKILSPSTGIILNNEMDDFSMPREIVPKNTPPPAPANFVVPGKRPLSSISPTIAVKNGEVKAIVGASGGANIIPGTAQVFMNHFVQGLEPFSAVAAPRFYHQLIPNWVSYENWTTPYGDHFELPAVTREFLKSRGHVLTPFAGGAICQFIVTNVSDHSGINKGIRKIVAVSDPRKGGFPAGI